MSYKGIIYYPKFYQSRELFFVLLEGPRLRLDVRRTHTTTDVQNPKVPLRRFSE